MGAPRVSKARIQLSVDAVRACNLPVCAITILRDGSVKIDTIDQRPVEADAYKVEEKPEPWN